MNYKEFRKKQIEITTKLSKAMEAAGAAERAAIEEALKTGLENFRQEFKKDQSQELADYIVEAQTKAIEAAKGASTHLIIEVLLCLSKLIKLQIEQTITVKLLTNNNSNIIN